MQAIYNKRTCGCVFEENFNIPLDQTRIVETCHNHRPHQIEGFGKKVNPITDRGIRHYKIVQPSGGWVTVIVAYGKSSNVCNAWFGYSDRVIGKAGGGGYDKTNTCLEQAVREVCSSYGAKLPPCDGAAGFNSVRDAAKLIGWDVQEVL